MAKASEEKVETVVEEPLEISAIARVFHWRIKENELKIEDVPGEKMRKQVEYLLDEAAKADQEVTS